jgi:hypothetical protein
MFSQTITTGGLRNDADAAGDNRRFARLDFAGTAARFYVNMRFNFGEGAFRSDFSLESGSSGRKIAVFG